MAPSPAYYVWAGSGKPYKLVRPAAALQRALRGRGLTVYDYPNDAHLKASTPEDHTPFSATGWPVKSAFGVGHAIDVMPRADTAAGRAENAVIARRLIADRSAGVAGVMWIKYLNWTDEQGVCRQERWMPDHVTRTSTDKGHIHVSGRSDCDNDDRADGYDPLATQLAEGYDDMAGFARGGDGKLYYVNQMTSREITAADIPAIKQTSAQGFGPPIAHRAASGANPVEWESADIRLGWGPGWAGPVLGAAAPVALSDAQLDVLAGKVATKLSALRFVPTA